MGVGLQGGLNYIDDEVQREQRNKLAKLHCNA